MIENTDEIFVKLHTLLPLLQPRDVVTIEDTTYDYESAWAEYIHLYVNRYAIMPDLIHYKGRFSDKRLLLHKFQRNLAELQEHIETLEKEVEFEETFNPF